MRILAAVNQQPEMAFVIHQVAQMAANTWADVTLLGICASEAAVKETAGLLDAYRNTFVSLIDGELTPYARNSTAYQLVQQQKGIWDQRYEDKDGRKDLRFRIRSGNAGKAVISEAEETLPDLIVMGCDNKGQCQWPNDAVKKVVRDAACSVLVIKEEKKPQMIVCCLDQDTVTQASIELINQMVTLHAAELEIVAINRANGLPSSVDQRMAQILGYYTKRNIRAWIKSVDAGALKAFVNEAAEKNLVALWMGKESFLSRIFSRQHLLNLTTEAESSILILR